MKLIGLTLLIAVTIFIVVSLLTYLIGTYPLSFGTTFIISAVLFVSYITADTYLN